MGGAALPLQLTQSERYRLLIASGGICECCGRESPLDRMEVYKLKGEFRDRQRGILLLCRSCIEELEVANIGDAALEALVTSRPFAERQLFRRILGGGSCECSAIDADIETLYREACDSWSLNGSG